MPAQGPVIKEAHIFQLTLALHRQLMPTQTRHTYTSPTPRVMAININIVIRIGYITIQLDTLGVSRHVSAVYVSTPLKCLCTTN